MFEIKENSRRKDNADFTESRAMDSRKSIDRFINISPQNYIKALEDTMPKKSMIPIILISIMDRDNRINMTLDELSELLQYPKTGLSVIFGEYKRRDFLRKIRNGVYMINPLISYKGSKYERDKLVYSYNQIKNGNGGLK
ncbi:MAG: replication/maintenance protein RepL [Peptostreptococcus porci]|uniref:replication/maintenance protein RepL n=1 Tax=Peptostreptococcus porci TaxID=2652282 RepID=UPI002A75A946|nr:replication/maintenance protein RepL [Peptostreptococcus porci]MDY2793928.1 replication/maintenance protein RepL [Peptostreptococcus porci]MDY5479572.1 replication/maintenance protein RepL [Peptostreptococcus porci]